MTKRIQKTVFAAAKAYNSHYLPEYSTDDARIKFLTGFFFGNGLEAPEFEAQILFEKTWAELATNC